MKSIVSYLLTYLLTCVTLPELAVWDNFEAFAAHFKSASDPSCEQFEAALKSKYSGLLKKLCSPQFVSDLGLVYDCLEELKLLSESLQKSHMNLPEADKLTRRSIRRIEHFKGKLGSKMTEAKSCASASLFGTTALKSNAKHVSINEKQFLQSLADNMRQRLLTTAAVAAQSTSATGSTQECESQGKLIIAQLSRTRVASATSAAEMKTPDPLWTIL